VSHVYSFGCFMLLYGAYFDMMCVCRFRLKDEVEFQVVGSSRWNEGTIIEVRGNGTYDIAHRDGTEELLVEESMIRLLPGRPNMTSSQSSALREGMKVEARYRGKARYYPGVIRRENRDGTYDIDYDDGEKETYVAAELIRPLEAAPRSPRSGGGGGSALREGMKVEARYRGSSRYTPAVIKRVNRDGTYDIDYDEVS
jgi:hypothetical protein